MARKYGKIEAGFWQSHKIRGLPDQSKLLLIYLFSCQHGNSIGCFVLPIGYIESDLGWSRKQVLEHLSILVSKRLIERCETTFLTWIRGWWGHNSIDNGKMAHAVNETIRSLPHSTSVFRNFIKDLALYIAKSGKRYLDSLDTSSDTGIETGTDTIEPEPEPEPEPEREAPAAPPARTREAKPTKRCASLDDLRLDDELAQLARDLRVDGPTCLAAFADDCRAKGKHWTDYRAAFRNWLRNEAKFRDQRAAARGGSPPNGRADDHGRIIPTHSRNPNIAQAAREGRDLYDEALRQSPNFRDPKEASRG